MTDEHPQGPDPFATPELSPRGARVLTVVGGLLAVVALFQLAIVTGPLGMAAGLLGHLKGDRWGFKVAVAAGITTLVGLSLQFLFANPFRGQA